MIHAAETNIQDELINRENDCIIPKSSPPKMHFDFEKDYQRYHQRAVGGEEGIGGSEETSSYGETGQMLMMSGTTTTDG